MQRALFLDSKGLADHNRLTDLYGNNNTAVWVSAGCGPGFSGKNIFWTKEECARCQPGSLEDFAP
jgi:hypothetical protein